MKIEELIKTISKPETLILNEEGCVEINIDFTVDGVTQCAQFDVDPENIGELINLWDTYCKECNMAPECITGIQFENYDHIDRFFYSIEEIDGVKKVRFMGNIYENDENSLDDRYRISVWPQLYMMLNEFVEFRNTKKLYDFLYGQISMYEKLTKEELIDKCKHFFSGEPGKRLFISEVNEKTPCGNYWFDCEMITQSDIQLSQAATKKFVVYIDTMYVRDAQFFVPEHPVSDGESVGELMSSDNNWNDSTKFGLFIGVFKWNDTDVDGLREYIATRYEVFKGSIVCLPVN